MDHDPIPEDAAAAAYPLGPRRTALLGDIRVDHKELKPLGGLNPYNRHFDIIGKQFYKLLVDYTGLTSKSRVLDIGCGTGRLAKQFQDHNNYHGFDVNAHFIDYCRQTYKRGHFDLCDVYHDEYNPAGSLNPASFEFPYTDNAFDVVVAVALFNHFYTPWVFQYIRQIARVIKPKGTALLTFLLLNQQSMTFINQKDKQPYKFPYRTDESWHDFESRPLFNVAQPEEGIRRAFIKHNLMIKEPIRYGEWCLSTIALAGPDVLLARKGGWSHG